MIYLSSEKGGSDLNLAIYFKLLRKDLYSSSIKMYFSGNNLLYLDPHTTQQAVNPEKMSQIPDEVKITSIDL